MTLDIDYLNNKISEQYPVIETMHSILHSSEVRINIDRNLKTFDVRNSICARIHADICMYNSLSETLASIDDQLRDLKDKGEHDSEPVWGTEDRGPKVSDKATILEAMTWYEDHAIGCMLLIWVNYEMTHTSALLYTSQGWKMSAKQMKIMKQSMTNWYNEFVQNTNNKDLISTFTAERQQYGYRLSGNVAKLASATKPPVQADLLTKLAMTQLVQVNDKQKKFDALLNKQPLVIKEQVNK